MAVVAAENNRVTARQYGAEERNRLKIAIRDRKFLLWENDIVNEVAVCQGFYSVFCLLFFFFTIILRSRLVRRINVRSATADTIESLYAP